MKLKHLQSALSTVPTPQFPSPNIILEQYATSPLLTSHVIFTALSRDDVGPSKQVLDLGCGTGMLSVGSALVGSSLVMCVDCDANALSVARDNIMAMGFGCSEEEEEDDEYQEGCKVEFILGKVNHVAIKTDSARTGGGGGRKGKGKGKRGNDRGKGMRGGGNCAVAANAIPTTNVQALDVSDDDGIPLRSKCVDTVLTNPPFGTKHNAGIDVTFLRVATRLARRAVYSFHKSSTRQYLMKTIREWGFDDVEVVAQMRFDIPKMYKFHNKDSVDVEVDLIRIGIMK